MTNLLFVSNRKMNAVFSVFFFQENYRMGGNFVWPKVSEVAEYRKKVRQTMLDVIDNTPLELPVTQESKWVRYWKRDNYITCAKNFVS